MADGVRIQPQAARLRAEGIGSAANRLFILRDWGRPLQGQPMCPTCGLRHECKTYHFQLDAEGTIIVSTTIWDRMLRMPDHGGFEQVNVVTKPPAQGLVLPPATVHVTPAKF